MSDLAPQPARTCAHPLDCGCECHSRCCDPTQSACALDYLPDDGGLAPWGCAACTPGQRAPHLAGCPSDGLIPALVRGAAAGSVRALGHRL